MVYSNQIRMISFNCSVGTFSIQAIRFCTFALTLSPSLLLICFTRDIIRIEMSNDRTLCYAAAAVPLLCVRSIDFSTRFEATIKNERLLSLIDRIYLKRVFFSSLRFLFHRVARRKISLTKFDNFFVFGDLWRFLWARFAGICVD